MFGDLKTFSATRSEVSVTAIPGLTEDSVVFVLPRSGDFHLVMTVNAMAMLRDVMLRQDTVLIVNTIPWARIVNSVLLGITVLLQEVRTMGLLSIKGLP